MHDESRQEEIIQGRKDSASQKDLKICQEELSIAGGDGSPVSAYHWHDSQKTTPAAVVQVVHGMAEHAMRYKETAEFLVSQGFHVLANDHRGHGKTAHGKIPGHYSDMNGWELIFHDLTAVRGKINSLYPDCPVFMLGHSMGSFMTMQYMQTRGQDLCGVILSGSNYIPATLAKSMRFIPWLEAKRQGRHGKSWLVDYLSFGSFNKPFKPNRTSFDWLSRDATQVDQYILDPMCGFRCTNQLWLDFLGGLGQIFDPAHLKKIPADLPVLIIGGSRDPISKVSGLKKLQKSFLKAGISKTECEILPDCRHEILNETNRREIQEKLARWLQKQLRARILH